MIFAVKLKRYIANASILDIIVGKLYYRQKLYPVILLEDNKNSKVSFYYAILFLDLAICLRIKSDW